MKKVVSLMLVLVLVLGMATVAFAASKTYALLDKNGQQSGILSLSGGDEIVRDKVVQGISSETFSPIEFYKSGLDGDYANALVVATDGNTVQLTKKEVSNSNITLKTVLSKGAAAINTGDTEIVYVDNTYGRTDSNGKVYQVAALKVVWNDEFKSNNTDGVDYIAKFFLVVNGRQWSDSGLTIEGNYKNDSESYSDASDGYVYMGDGVIIKADVYGRDIEMDLDNGVSVFGKMFKEKKYYAISTMDSYNDDEDELMDKYDIDTVYHIKQVGVAAVADYVKLNDESSDMFVYDGELNYLGKGNEKLPFSTTYYLAAKQLEIEEDEEPIEEGEGDGYEVPGETGGEPDGYPENVNDNPGTGR